MPTRLVGGAALALCALLVLACAGPRGRIMGAEEEDYVGARRAGTATYDRLVEEVLRKLLKQYGHGPTKLRVAFLGVENRSAEDLGDLREQIYETIDTALENSGRFDPVSRRFVEAALRETRLRPDQLMLPRHRRTFAQALEAQRNPVEALLFAKITSGTTRGAGVKQRSYMLTLELVDVATGRFHKESARIRKAYTR